MKIVYFDKAGTTVLVDIDKASVEQLARSLDLKDKQESIVKEIVERFKALEEKEKDIRKKYCRLRSAASQFRGALYFSNI